MVRVENDKGLNNSDKFHYTDFTRNNYRRLLKIARSKYVFRFYHNYHPEEKFVLWRHDIDLSPQSALRLAQIEQEEGVQTTYFLHLHNVFYNLLEKAVIDIVCKIKDLGHAIGLHFDPAFYDINNVERLNETLKGEAYFLENILECKLNVFSFHNPSVEFMRKYINHEYADLVNTYAFYFQNEVGYCSDSNGYWRHRRLENVLLDAEDNRLQVLTHPGWWQDEVMPPRQRVQRCIDGRATSTSNYYDKILEESGRINVTTE